jgi:hypothetical protein
MFDRFVTPIIALGLGFLVWLYIRGRDQETLEREVPVEIVVAAEQASAFEIDRTGAVGVVPVEFTGPPSRIKEVKNQLQQGAVRLQRTITVPDDQLQEPSYRPTVRLDANELSLPPGVHASVAPSKGELRLVVRRIVEKQLPVKPTHNAGERVESIQVEPATVLVRGPKEVLDKMAFVETRLWELPPGLVGQEVSQITPMPANTLRLVDHYSNQALKITPPTVQARVTLRPLQKTFELTDVPVGFLCPPNFPFRAQFKTERAAAITLKVTGPATAAKPAVKAYVDLTARAFSAGLQPDEPIKLADLPPGYQLAQDPKLLRADIVLTPLDVPMKPSGGP